VQIDSISSRFSPKYFIFRFLPFPFTKKHDVADTVCIENAVKMCAVLMATGQGDVTIAMDDEDLLKLMTGQLGAQQVCTLLLMTLYCFEPYYCNYI